MGDKNLRDDADLGQDDNELMHLRVKIVPFLACNPIPSRLSSPFHHPKIGVERAWQANMLHFDLLPRLPMQLEMHVEWVGSESDK